MSELLLSTWSFGAIGNDAGWKSLSAGGTALDAVVAGATAVEDHEGVDCVGVGGTPDAAGQVTLDACVMTNPDRCGSVACIRSFPHATAIARRIMERTIHFMLVGEGAEAFAQREGFQPRPLLTESARARWNAWRAALGAHRHDANRGWTPRRNIEDPQMHVRNPNVPSGHDTVSFLARDRSGQLAGACSTSGMAFKVPGRVGDSPIIGHGVYVDQETGAAAATGNGELIMGVCGSFLVVELMRQGADPQSACTETLRRIASRFDLLPDHQVAFIALAAPARSGAWASAALRPGFVHVISDAAGTRVERSPVVLIDD